MKKTMLILSASSLMVLLACNSNNSSSQHHDGMNHENTEMPMQENTTAEANIKMVAPTFSNVDPGVSSYMKSMTMDYLAVKNALTNSNESDAAAAAGKMHKSMMGFDKSLLTADQKKVYDDIESDLKEHAEHISESKLDHQREHFTSMSKDMYDLVKAYGAGMTLYHDHCPMYNNGAMWLSESKDIKNPYYGDKMMTCGNVEEMLQ